MNESPFFIVGTERSGSNLLRAILNSHSELTIPHPPHIMKELGPKEKNYGDLNIDENFLKLIDDVINLVQLHFVKWPVPLDREKIFNQCPMRTLYAVNAVIYNDYAVNAKKPRWGCKSTFMIHYIDEILKVHPKAQFIHLVRDGRDVAVSAKKSVFNHFHPYYVAKLWSAEQSIAIEWKKKLSPSQMTTLHYEDLILNPKSSIQNVCRFLQVEYQEEMLRYFEKNEITELSRLSDSWKNVSKAVLSDNSQKYKKELSAKEIELFEAISFHEMHSLGYQLENDQKHLEKRRENLTNFQKFGYYLVEKGLQLKVEIKAMINDKNFFQRWKKKVFVWRLND